MIETSSNLHRSSSSIFDNLRRMFGQRWEIGIQTNFGKPWDIFGKWLEIFVKSPQTSSCEYYIMKRKLHGRLEIRNLPSRVEKYFQHSKINFVSRATI